MKLTKLFEDWYSQIMVPGGTRSGIPKDVPDYIIRLFLMDNVDWNSDDTNFAEFIRKYNVSRSLLRDLITEKSIQSQSYESFEERASAYLVTEIPDPTDMTPMRINNQLVSPMYIDTYTVSHMMVWLTKTKIFNSIHPTPLQLTALYRISESIENDDRKASDWESPSVWLTVYGKKSPIPMDLVDLTLSRDDACDFVTDMSLRLIQNASMVDEVSKGRFDDNRLASFWDKVMEVCADSSETPNTLITDLCKANEMSEESLFLPNGDMDYEKIYRLLYEECVNDYNRVTNRILYCKTELSHIVTDWLPGTTVNDITPEYAFFIAYIRVRAANGCPKMNIWAGDDSIV